MTERDARHRINGERVGSSERAGVNPATGKASARLGDATPKVAQPAIDAALAAFRTGGRAGDGDMQATAPGHMADACAARPSEVVIEHERISHSFAGGHH